MSNFILYLLAALSVIFFVVGFMGTRKSPFYGAAVVLLLVIVVWRYVDSPTADPMDNDVVRPEAASPADQADQPAPITIRDDLAPSLLELTTACNESAQATIAKATSADVEPHAALNDARSAAETCRRAANKISVKVGRDNVAKEAILSCRIAMSAKVNAMESLANMLDGIATREDIEQYKARRSEASQNEFICQSALTDMRDMQQITAMERAKSNER